MRALPTLCFLLLVILVPSISWASGSYKGRLILDFTDHPRDGIVVEPFAYVDPEGREWPVPRGSKVDGASIPRPLWSLIGGPWEGPYRQASVIHDHFCNTKDRGWRNVHKVFYDAMRSSGVNEVQAKIMYAAVVYFGPKWKKEFGIDGKPQLRTYQQPFDQVEMDRLRDWVKASNPSTDQISNLVAD